MRSLKSLLMVVAALILVSCSMSAKPEKNETEKVSSAQGEVIVLNKADFLSKYIITKRIRLNGCTKETNLLLLIFMQIGAVLARKYLRS